MKKPSSDSMIKCHYLCGMKIAIIGGGAAGFFSALAAKRKFREADVVIYEKSQKILSKVKISGGGRCNVTNATFENRELSKHYPRGENYLRKAFEQFNAQATVDWFEKRGVQLKTYPDNCIFPQSNDSQTIIDCFLKEALELGINIRTGSNVKSILQKEDHFLLEVNEEFIAVDRLIITTGGQPKRSGLEWIEKLGHTIIDPVPSLFTFNMPTNPIRELMGNVVEKTIVKVEGTKLVGSGPLLVTHWGMSGPAILQLSAWGARYLAEKNYQFAILVNWLNETGENELRSNLQKISMEHGGKMITNLNPFPMTSRLWEHLLDRSEIPHDLRWKDLAKKHTNKMVNTLLNDRYEVQGKTTFKEEFVTAGGVDLKEIDFKTMESRIVPGLFFAGEVLDLDGITGGFNFQAAWTTGYIAGMNSGNTKA
jgi:predicted Rossmann fold flavoprotein